MLTLDQQRQLENRNVVLERRLQASNLENMQQKQRIDNNLTEQSIRPCKLGAKNWLFIGHPDTGHRSAVIYTLIESCKRHDIEPQAYLTDILKKLPAMTNHEATELTPEKWKDQAN